MTFVKYMHVERLTKDNMEVEGILNGKVYVYPKLDGSNHCVWYDDDLGEVRCASRNHVLTSEYDSTKFVHTFYLSNKEKIEKMANDNKNLVFYGEFMRPHVIKDYENKVWDDWFIFDVFNTETKKWMTFDEYMPILAYYGVSFIPPLEIIDNPTTGELNKCVENNHFMMEGDALGEGVVIKNYEFVNVYGRTTWAKIVREEFKASSKITPKERGEDTSIENKIAEMYLNPDFIEKEYYKFVDENGTWNDKMIPAFISHVYAEWWKDYSYDVLATSRDTINLGELRKKMAKKIVAKAMRIQR